MSLGAAGLRGAGSASEAMPCRFLFIATRGPVHTAPWENPEWPLQVHDLIGQRWLRGARRGDRLTACRRDASNPVGKVQAVLPPAPAAKLSSPELKHPRSACGVLRRCQRQRLFGSVQACAGQAWSCGTQSPRGRRCQRPGKPGSAVSPAFGCAGFMRRGLRGHVVEHCNATRVSAAWRTALIGQRLAPVGFGRQCHSGSLQYRASLMNPRSRAVARGSDAGRRQPGTA